MNVRSEPPVLPRTRFTATVAGDGQPGPIEERIGRRLVRVIDATSPEGRRLLAERSIDWVGPDGAPLGSMPTLDAYRLLIARLELRLDRIAEEIDGAGRDEVGHRLRGAIQEIRQRGDALRRR